MPSCQGAAPTSILETLHLDISFLRGKGAWVAQLVKCPTLDFDSGHDLTIFKIEPQFELGILSLPLSLVLPLVSHVYALSLK